MLILNSPQYKNSPFRDFKFSWTLIRFETTWIKFHATRFGQKHAEKTYNHQINEDKYKEKRNQAFKWDSFTKKNKKLGSFGEVILWIEYNFENIWSKI